MYHMPYWLVKFYILSHSIHKSFFFFNEWDFNLLNQNNKIHGASCELQSNTLTQKAKVFFFFFPLIKFFIAYQKRKIKYCNYSASTSKGILQMQKRILFWDEKYLPCILHNWSNHFHFSSNSLVIDSHIPLSQNMINRCSPSQFAN